MAEELISKYVDRQGIQEDTDFMLDRLNKVYAVYQKINSSLVDLKGIRGLRELAADVQKVADSQKRLAEETKALLQAKKLEADINLKNARAKTEEAKANTETAKSAREAAKAKEIEARLTKSLNKEIDANNKAREREQRNLEKLNNEYEQLKAKYQIAANTAKQLAAAKGIDNEETKEAIAQAQKYYASLIQIEKAVGQNQRNVGNYTQATFALTQVLREAPAFANSFATGISAIGNNIPQLVDQFKILRTELGSGFKAFGILAKSLLSFQALLPLGFLLIQSYGSEIGAFFGRLFSGGRALDEATRKQKLFNDTIREGTREAQSDIVRLEAFRRKITDLNVPLTERLRVVEEYNKTADKTNQIDKTQIGNLDLINKKIDKQNKLVLARAIATAALSKLTDASTQFVDAQLELDLLAKKTGLTTDILEKEIKLFERRNNVLGGQAFRSREAREEQTRLQESTSRNLNLTRQELGLLSNLIEKRNKAKQELEGINATLAPLIDTPEKASGKKDNSTEEAKRLADERLKVIFEAQAVELQRIIDFNKEVAADEKENFQDRLQATREGLTIAIDLVNRRYDLEKMLGKKTAEELKLIEVQRNDDLIRTKKEYEKQFTKITDDEQALRDADSKEAAANTEIYIDNMLDAWIKGEKAKTKATEDENKKREKADEEYAKRQKQLREQLVQELTALSFALLTADLERQKNALRDQLDLLEERKAKDIEVANQTIANTQERAAAIQIIEARAQAQREQLQQRQRDLDNKKAQFDRAQTIANIVQQTAKNVVEWFGTPLALLAAAIGAAQIAAVIAQPIPRYKHGKNVPGSLRGGDSYEGPAIVGDGGKPELILREDGRAEITPDRPTLTYVTKRDIVLPDARKALAGAALAETDKALIGATGSPQTSDSEEIAKAIGRMERNLVQSIQNQPRLNLSASAGGMKALWKWGANQTQYINDKTNWS